MCSKEYATQKVAVIKAERRVLNTLGFVVHVHHPHKFIYVFMHALQLLSKESNELLQKAWNYMNDGLRTDMFLRYSPETIACACIHLAARTVSNPVVLPKQPFPWFELFDASDRDVKSACSMIVDLYARKKPVNFLKITQELSILTDRIQLQMKPDSNIEKAIGGKKNTTDIKVTIEKKTADIDSKLAAIMHKHTEKPFGVKERTNGKVQTEDNTRSSDNNRHHRKRSHSRDRDDRRRRDRSRSREQQRSSRPRTRSRSHGKSYSSKKYDDRDRNRYETKKRRDK